MSASDVAWVTHHDWLISWFGIDHFRVFSWEMLGVEEELRRVKML